MQELKKANYDPRHSYRVFTATKLRVACKIALRMYGHGANIFLLFIKKA